MAPWATTINEFDTTVVLPGTQKFSYDPIINENNPGIQYIGTESNAIYAETREVAGDFWVVQNAQFNGTSWIPQNLALPAYAWHHKANGVLERMFCAAGTNPVVWTTLAAFDSLGAFALTPQQFTSAAEILLSGAGTWNGSGLTFTAIKLNIIDTASAAGSKLLDLQVGGVSKFSVDKAGNVTENAGLRKIGSATNLLVDGTLQTITYPTAYPTATNQVFLTVVTNAQSDTLGTPQIVAKRANGFDFVVPGGIAGHTANFDYEAYGN